MLNLEEFRAQRDLLLHRLGDFVIDRENETVTIEFLAKDLHWPVDQVTRVADFWRNEKLVEIEEDRLGLTQEGRKRIEAEQPIRLRAGRDLFMRLLYARTKGDRSALVNMYELALQLGLTPYETDLVVEYLSGEGLVQDTGSEFVLITHEGVKAVEREVPAEAIRPIIGEGRPSIATKFNWTSIDDEQFEELVFAIVKSKNPKEIDWRRGPGDKGRDVQAVFACRGQLEEPYDESYFVEVKHHKAGVSPDDIASALAWAQAEQPSVFVIAVSSNLTTGCRDNVEAWQRNNPRVRVIAWERKRVEELILSSSAVRAEAIRFGLLPPAINELLPAEPDKLRPLPGHETVGLEMQYRYWITDEEIDQLDYVVNLLQRLDAIVTQEADPYQHFEEIFLGIPNWSTFLKLFQAECRLLLATRDYLLAQVSSGNPEDMEPLAETIAERVRALEAIGSQSMHVD